jgi:polyisoprenoid-binding protein YceI
MNARLTLLCIALLLASCASVPETHMPPAAPGDEVYAIDPGHTFPSFEISHLGWSTHRGRFNKTSGWITLNRAARSGSIQLTIDADSIDTGDVRLEERLRKPDFLDTATYPDITFKSNKMRFEGDALIAVDGDLTLHGVTRPVTLTVTSFRCGKFPVIGTEVCGANAETTIKRADFGITVFPTMIGGDVKLLIQVEAHKR